jgi:adenylate cyclase class IV
MRRNRAAGFGFFEEVEVGKADEAEEGEEAEVVMRVALKMAIRTRRSMRRFYC